MSEQLNNENEILKNDMDENVTPIADVEWCYQFFDNDPVVFGFGQEAGKANPLVIQLRPVEEDVLAFNHNGMTFKIFPRPISAESIEIRNEQKQNDNADVV
jgi:hypothetical protein